MTTPYSYINDASVDLNLSLPESVLDRVLCILLPLLTYFFTNRSLGAFFTDSVFRFRDSVSVSGFRIPCFSAAHLIPCSNVVGYVYE